MRASVSTRKSYREEHQHDAKIRQIGFAIVAALAVAGTAGQAFAQGERFEVTSIKAVRPTLVNTIAALQARDVARAKAAFEAYDSA